MPETEGGNPQYSSVSDWEMTSSVDETLGHLNELHDVFTMQGWATACTPERIAAAVSHTVGLESTWGSPDLVCSGLSVEVSSKIFANLVGCQLQGGLYSASLEGDDLAFYLVELDRGAVERYLPWARLFYQEHAVRPDGSHIPIGFRAFQLLWPDGSGLFPGHEGYDHERYPQQLLKAGETP